MKTISPHELKELMGRSNDLDLIDVRSPAEYRAVHVRGARLVPLESISWDALTSGGDKKGTGHGTAYLLCKGGTRARLAAERLVGAGEGVDVVVVDGGTDACCEAGVPVVRGSGGMSIERQVRIAAGALVAIGTLVGVTVSPWALVLPAFVGCGLVFAGITDTCGMGLMLARMPWNR